jgi:hypothetical protein
MDIGSVGSVSSALSQARTGDSVAIAVLKKANEAQAQTAMQLIQALPQPTASVTPGLGNSVNTFA